MDRADDREARDDGTPPKGAQVLAKLRSARHCTVMVAARMHLCTLDFV
jgi:hypothetical protein